MEFIDETFDGNPIPKRTHWFTVLVALLMVYVVFIVGIEVFWYFFAGGFSPILGCLAFMCATMVAARVVGERFASRNLF